MALKVGGRGVLDFFADGLKIHLPLGHLLTQIGCLGNQYLSTLT